MSVFKEVVLLIFRIFCTWCEIPLSRKKEKLKAIPKLVLPRTHSTYDQRIPKIIHQTHETNELSSSTYDAVFSFINVNPEYEYRFYTAKDREDFILKHFGCEYLDLYLSLNPGAFRADFFRYCVLYICGGVYIDCKSSSVKPFREFIPKDDSFFIFTYNDGKCEYLQNGFFGAVKGCFFLRCSIDQMIIMIRRHSYGECALDITGPYLLLSVYSDMKDKHTVNLIGILTHDTTRFLIGDVEVLRRIPQDYYSSRDIGYLLNEYVYQWWTGDIYKNEY